MNLGLTGYTGKKLSGKILDLCTRERHKIIALQKVENTLSQKIGDNADMVAIVEAVA